MLEVEGIQIGIYEHYKGKEYEVLGTVIHTETQEELVYYKALYEGDFPAGTLWARPLKMFKENVLVGGIKKERFKFSRNGVKS